eukprot:TRINITY_DN113877_c0_g1_i1.p2 TRINITY_DN113877_c0_g1~~TRINITY_DN113877_c0_g1_i1.p2  ORF type:complete len:238 (+),score=69.10 TRINITY_DN113877_c0_g1_i1:104-817(+)
MSPLAESLEEDEEVVGKEAEKAAASAPQDLDADVEGEENVADMTCVQNLLEEMNAASDDVNAAQKALGKLEQERERLLQRWQAKSARLAQKIGANTIAEALPLYAQMRSSSDARRAAEAASRGYLKAAEAFSEKDKLEPSLSRLASSHAQWVEQYQSLQRELEATCRQSPLAQTALAAALPYFQAEGRHRTRMAKLESAVRQESLRLSSCRGRYRGALDGLEALSEEAHRRRSACAR